MLKHYLNHSKLLLAIAITLITAIESYSAGYKIALIYSGSDTTVSSSYQSFLVNKGFKVTLVNQATVGSFNFQGYNLIVAGPNTSTTWQYWGTDTTLYHYIKNANIPVLGIGSYGGGGLFKQLKLSINGGNCGHGTSTTVRVSSKKDSLVSFPNVIPLLSPDSSLRYAQSGIGNDELYIPYLTHDVKVHAIDSSNIGYALVASEGIYHFWGINDASNNFNALNSNGQNLFLNLVYYAIASNGTHIVTDINNNVQSSTFDGCFYVDNSNSAPSLIFNGTSKVLKVLVLDQFGRPILDKSEPGQILTLYGIKSGMYIVNANFEGGIVNKKVFLE